MSARNPKIYLINWRKNNPWSNSYFNAKYRCNNKNDPRYKDYGGKGIKFLITMKEVKILWFRDKAYLMKHPSIDRINNDGNYIFDNCRFIELGENSAKELRKPILQFDKQMNFIKEWSSASEAGTSLNIIPESIYNNLKKRSKTAGTCIWKYK